MYSRNHRIPNGADHQYGRRIESDRSWTVYHVFTGVPADSNAGATTGLNRAEATKRMMSLNRRTEERTFADRAMMRATGRVDTESVM